MLLDLHCHSTCSDGSLSPGEVARQAGARGVELFCLTDHDTVDGFDATVEELPSATVLRGLELSCHERGRSIHVLLYGVPDGQPLAELQTCLDVIQVARRERIHAICQRLLDCDVHVDPGRILARAAGRTVGRPDVARALLEAGVVTSLREAFTRFLRDGGPAHVPSTGLSVAEGVGLGYRIGARMSLAHPHVVGERALVRDLFVRLRGHGLDGIEAFYGGYARAQQRDWLQLADELDLVATGGSDFHGDVLPQVSRPGVDISEPHAARLREWLGVSAT